MAAPGITFSPWATGDMALIELLNRQTILIALIRDELPRRGLRARLLSRSRRLYWLT
ncbi:protein of unknown function [Burkholderia multivorans]